jgi:hypothetical protein
LPLVLVRFSVANFGKYCGVAYSCPGLGSYPNSPP